LKHVKAFLFGLIFILIVGADYTYSQTIAEKDLPLFAGKIKVNDSWGDRLDFSHFIDWRIDSQVISGNWIKIKSPDGGGCWVISEGKPVEAPSPLLLSLKERQGSRYKYQLLAVIWGIDLFTNRLLSVWERVGQDSLRFLGIDSAVSVAGIDKIKQIQYFPDSSILIYCQLSDCYHGICTGCDQFFRQIDFCRFQKLYGTSWHNYNPVKTYIKSDRLCENRYRVSEITEFLSRPDTGRIGVVLAGPNLTYDGSILDSAKIRVIDLWELAKEKMGEGK
jgi:hypothetical protein